MKHALPVFLIAAALAGCAKEGRGEWEEKPQDKRLTPPEFYPGNEAPRPERVG